MALEEGGGPMGGTGFDAQLVNIVYKDNLSKNMSKDEAMKRAIDTVLMNKETSYIEPETGLRMTKTKPGIFYPGEGKDPAPTSGGSTLAPEPTDLLTEPTPVDRQGELDALEAESPRMGIYEAVKKGVGAGASTAEAWAKTGGQLGLGVNEEVIQARAVIRNLERKITTALAISGRPPVFEQQLLQKLSPDAKFWDSVEAATVVAQELQRETLKQYLSDEAAVEDPAIHVKEKRKIRKRMRALSDILDGFNKGVSGGGGSKFSIKRIR